jgi:hypothetical protein
MLQAALLAGTDVHLRDAWGHTALHWAASRGHEAVTALLLSKKVRLAGPGLPDVHGARQVMQSVQIPPIAATRVQGANGDSHYTEPARSVAMAAQPKLSLFSGSQGALQCHPAFDGSLGFFAVEQAAVASAAQANAALLSTESPGHSPVTAADLAAANGHSGLAAFLGESLLNELLANLKIENRRLDGALCCVHCLIIKTATGATTAAGPQPRPSHQRCPHGACRHHVSFTRAHHYFKSLSQPVPTCRFRSSYISGTQLTIASAAVAQP